MNKKPQIQSDIFNKDFSKDEIVQFTIFRDLVREEISHVDSINETSTLRQCRKILNLPIDQHLLKLRSIQYLSKALSSARNKFLSVRGNDRGEESTVSQQINELIMTEMSSPEVLDQYDMAQLSVLIVSISYIP